MVFFKSKLFSKFSYFKYQIYKLFIFSESVSRFIFWCQCRCCILGFFFLVLNGLCQPTNILLNNCGQNMSLLMFSAAVCPSPSKFGSPVNSTFLHKFGFLRLIVDRLFTLMPFHCQLFQMASLELPKLSFSYLTMNQF